MRLFYELSTFRVCLKLLSFYFSFVILFKTIFRLDLRSTFLLDKASLFSGAFFVCYIFILFCFNVKCPPGKAAHLLFSSEFVFYCGFYWCFLSLLCFLVLWMLIITLFFIDICTFLSIFNMGITLGVLNLNYVQNKRY